MSPARAGASETAGVVPFHIKNFRFHFTFGGSAHRRERTNASRGSDRQLFGRTSTLRRSIFGFGVKNSSVTAGSSSSRSKVDSERRSRRQDRIEITTVRYERAFTGDRPYVRASARASALRTDVTVDGPSRAFVRHGRNFYPMLASGPAFRVNFRSRRR